MKNSVWNYGTNVSLFGRTFREKSVLNYGLQKFSAFTLAEMMVVMLIMSIILAAMAPVMTTRNKSESLSPWRYTDDGSNAYFGIAKSQIAMIGQRDLAEDNSDDPARLIINADSDSTPIHLSFKRNNTKLGRLQLTGDANLVLGSADLASATGTKNSSFGINSMDGVTSGSANTAIGAESLKSVTSGSYNTGVGEASLYSNTSGEGNIAIGSSALRNNTTANYNVGIGQDSISGNTSGGSNTAVGYGSFSRKSGNNNVAIGALALQQGGGDGNIAIGANANNVDMEGLKNTISIGYDTDATGEGSLAIGHSIANGQASIAISPGALSSPQPRTTADDTGSIAIGGNVQVKGGSTSIGTGSQATGLSSVAINAYATANSAIAIGDSSSASAESSIAIGNGASASKGASIAIGHDANATSDTPYSSFANSIALGNSSEALGNSSISIGDSRAHGTTSIAIGNNANALGSQSISIGESAGSSNSEAPGAGIIAIGTYACRHVTGMNKVCIGNYSGPAGGSADATDSSESIYLGRDNTTVHIPGNLVVDGHVILGVDRGSYVFARIANQEAQINQYNKSLMSLLKSKDWNGDDDNVCRYTPSHLAVSERDFFRKYIGSSWEETKSDRRLKYIGKENSSGLEKIRQLKVFNYTFKKDKNKTPHVGVIAQDLQKVFPDAVKKGVDGFLTIRLEDMFFAMVNAIKELDAKYQAQEKRINDLEKRIEALEEKLK